MNFDKNFFEQIKKIEDYFVKKDIEKSQIMNTLCKEVFNIDPSFFDTISSPPEHNYAKFEEKFSVSNFVENFVKDYSILASDGSRITIEERLPFPFYVINVASVFEKIGKSPVHEVKNKAEIFFNENDIYDLNGELLSEQDINLKMLLKEAEFLSENISKYNPDITLFDGSLILWGLKRTQKINAQTAIKIFESPITTSVNLKKPIAGYISGTRSKEVIKSLILYLKGKGISLDYRLLLNLNDSDLINYILKKNQRTSVFSSTEKLLSYYMNKIYFYFIKTEYEVIRVEIPDFVYENKNLFDKLNKILFTEINRGKGYPLILKLAHFEAVIGDQEKQFIENSIRSKLGEFTDYSEKFFSKISRKI
ncbi:MAG: DNA double-strand break repair nuclease NurA [Caldisericum exile]|uniref:DNA double-strand break repair nuclease NurA n=1 Tax=Caldisericum exile TaxID=693075 RepID=UPI003C72F190